MITKLVIILVLLYLINKVTDFAEYLSKRKRERTE